MLWNGLNVRFLEFLGIINNHFNLDGEKNNWQMEKPENQKYFILSNSFKVAELFVTKILVPCHQKQKKAFYNTKIFFK